MKYKRKYKIEATVSISNDIMGSLMSIAKRDYSSENSGSFDVMNFIKDMDDACIYCEDIHLILHMYHRCC